MRSGELPAASTAGVLTSPPVGKERFCQTHTFEGWTRVNWALAECQGMDSDLFFPVCENGPCKAQIDRAKAVCARCPIADDCRRWAIATAQADGVWGGLSTSERRHWCKQLPL
jgi:WhiB family redox-sensing transcriptional regulator